MTNLAANPNWRKSSFSAGAEHCVELAVTGDRLSIRDSKNPDGGVITVPRVTFIPSGDVGRWMGD
ncbi:hypothetical protein ALI144C_16420 [Actinosynnema sp. ALI-1.44]|uniref:DUF397 domain-containing protein n=1 Tax=Actinosynnema sp. ALI-1.44 TaxID=1933779 RepID=UPI00097C7084|nr:DUF397 domain-containing protein [Actinosynnema sp. ALI-1.44]ONI84245.1 hypothetical protein ALI144C_16420 [Actinosynnema sp. ALI-1.44]